MGVRVHYKDQSITGVYRNSSCFLWESLEVNSLGKMQIYLMLKLVILRHIVTSDR
jgi:hypothetical protein